jgi:hypothetical protein
MTLAFDESTFVLSFAEQLKFPYASNREQKQSVLFAAKEKSVMLTGEESGGENACQAI